MNAPRVEYDDENVTLIHGDALDAVRTLDDGEADCIVTSPPYYGLRDYDADGQYGLEETPAEYVAKMVELFRECRRVLADDGTFWLNLGDSYSSGHGGKPGKGSAMLTGGRRVVEEQARSRGSGDRPHKSLLGIPWRVALALQDDGWILRNEIIWNKPNAMPESVTDRLSSRHEHLFMFTKGPRYWFDLDPIREAHAHPDKRDDAKRTDRGEPGRRPQRNRGGQHPKGRNPGDVWTIPTTPFAKAHFATFPVELPLRAIRAGCKPGGTVLDPFSGSGTTGKAALQAGRKYVGVELNLGYIELSLQTRLAQSIMELP